VCSRSRLDLRYPCRLLHERSVDRHVTFREVLNRDLGVMDRTAVTLCMENRLSILVFNLFEEGNIERVVKGERVGTLVR
jgi:uridylate kinase